MSDDDIFPTEPPAAGTELETLLGGLERQRATFAWKTGGLTTEQLRIRLAPSTMTLGGLLKHLALVEADWFVWKFLGRSPGEPWVSVDWGREPAWPWTSAADDSAEELTALWSAAVERSRAATAEALADGGADRLSAFETDDGQRLSLRHVLVTVLEEYARHVGHADLIRESIDGLVGEDPPR